MQSILRQRLLKDVTSFRFGESREDSGKSWLHKNDHLYAGRTYLTRSPGKTKCFAKFIQRAMPMPLSTVMIWTGSMLISNTVKGRVAFAGSTKVRWRPGTPSSRREPVLRDGSIIGDQIQRRRRPIHGAQEARDLSAMMRPVIHQMEKNLPNRLRIRPSFRVLVRDHA
jgi:hypothetical protein